MGGRHVEKQYPKSNISMQETMFIPVTAKNYEDAQEVTVRLQNRLMQIIEKADGCSVMGIGLEGGLASYIEMEEGDIVPEQRLWRMARQAIEEVGLKPGIDVALALDPAASELEIAHNKHKFGEDITMEDERWEVGVYRFWQMDKAPVTMNSQEMAELYRKTIEDENVPIVSIEDGFSEQDDAQFDDEGNLVGGWAKLMEMYGGELDEHGMVDILSGKILVIGDDYVTTNDKTIEEKAEFVDANGKKRSNTNATLIKANQIGSLSETILAMLTALGKGQELVVSHRSKSPNDDMEAQIALAAFSLGLKAGGGANTERLFKYQAVLKVLKDAVRKQEIERTGRAPLDEEAEEMANKLAERLEITSVSAYEEPTNAGIPTVGLEIAIGVRGSEKWEKMFVSTGATPLGTSAGTGEAIHLVDKVIEPNPLTAKYPQFFTEPDEHDGTLKFKRSMTSLDVEETSDSLLMDLWRQANRYGGKGVQNAVQNVQDLANKHLIGKKISAFEDLTQIDKMLLKAEIDTAVERGKLSATATQEEQIAFMQRKGNLGMNAILSLSLGLARLKGKMEGQDLWELLRYKMEETMARVIAANGGLEMLENDARRRVQMRTGQKLWGAMAEQLSFDELKEGLKNVNRNRPKEIPLYQLLRDQLDVYNINNVGAVTIAEAPGEENPLPEVLQSDIALALDSIQGIEHATIVSDFSPITYRVENLIKSLQNLRAHLHDLAGKARPADVPGIEELPKQPPTNLVAQALAIEIIDNPRFSDSVAEIFTRTQDWQTDPNPEVLAEKLPDLGHTLRILYRRLNGILDSTFSLSEERDQAMLNDPPLHRPASPELEAEIAAAGTSPLKLGGTSPDSAAGETTDPTHGGIDLDDDMIEMNIKRDGSGLAIPAPQTILDPNMGTLIPGFIPVTINVTPVNVQLILGDAGTEDNTRDISYKPSLDVFDNKRDVDLEETDQLSFLK